MVSSLGTNFSSGTKTILKVGEDEDYCINKVPCKLVRPPLSRTTRKALAPSEDLVTLD